MQVILARSPCGERYPVAPPISARKRIRWDEHKCAGDPRKIATPGALPGRSTIPVRRPWRARVTVNHQAAGSNPATGANNRGRRLLARLPDSRPGGAGSIPAGPANYAHVTDAGYEPVTRNRSCEWRFESSRAPQNSQGEARARRVPALEAGGRWAEHRTLTNRCPVFFRTIRLLSWLEWRGTRVLNGSMRVRILPGAPSWRIRKSMPPDLIREWAPVFGYAPTRESNDSGRARPGASTTGELTRRGAGAVC